MDAKTFKNKIANYNFDNENDVIDLIKNLDQFLNTDFLKNASIFTTISAVHTLMKTTFNLFSKVSNQRFSNIQTNKNFLFYDVQLEELAKRIIKVQAEVNKYYHISLLDNQAIRTLLLFYKARLCADKTFMSLARYGRDGIILKMDRNGNALDMNNAPISATDLSICLDNLTKNDNNLRKPDLLASNLESKSKLVASYFSFASVIDDNAIISLQRENRQNGIMEDESNEDEQTAEDIAFNEEVAEDEENRNVRANLGYDVDKYDGFMLSLIYKKDPLISQIFLSLDPVFCNKLNALVQNEIAIRRFFRIIDDRYKVYRRIKGFNFSGFKTGLWIGYPDCKFYYKDENDNWKDTIISNAGSRLDDILLNNYYASENDLKEEIRKKYIAHFKNLNNVFETRLATLKAIKESGRWNNKQRLPDLIPTEAEILQLANEWKKLLEQRMKIISNNFTVFSKDEYDNFFENNDVDTTISVIKLKK